MMGLILTRRIHEVFYLGTDRVVLESIRPDYGSALLSRDGSSFEVVGDKLTEISPSVFVGLGRKAKNSSSAVSLVIEAPQSVTVSRDAPGGQNVPDPTFRNYEIDPIAAFIAQDQYGISPNRLGVMARHSAPVTHPTWNRRYEDMVFRIRGNIVLDLKPSQRPRVTMLEPRVFAPWASSCSICRGSLSLVVFEDHAPCNGRGCLDCEAGQLRVESRCIAYRRDKPPTCSDLVKLED